MCFHSVSKDYLNSSGELVHALKDINLEVKQGESLAIIGPSGCGKSTMLRLACGLDFPTSGNVSIDDEVITKPRKGNALILQDFGLLPWKTVYANAELGLRIQKAPASIRQERTMKALEQTGLAEFANSFPRELSGGMQQRLALARSIAMDADLLLMDEPLSALDALLREKLQDLLYSLQKNNQHTQIIVTHSIEEAVFLGDRVVVMSPSPGKIAAILDNPCANHENEEIRQAPEFFHMCNTLRNSLIGEAHE